MLSRRLAIQSFEPHHFHIQVHCLTIIVSSFHTQSVVHTIGEKTKREAL